MRTAIEKRQSSDEKDVEQGTNPVKEGPEGGCWLRWRGKKHDIPKGNVYKLIDFMWQRESAAYDVLVGPVFDDSVEPQTIRSLANKVNNALARVGVPWRLSTNSTSQQLVKKPS